MCHGLLDGRLSVRRGAAGELLAQLRAKGVETQCRSPRAWTRVWEKEFFLGFLLVVFAVDQAFWPTHMLTILDCLQLFRV
jgi:hypothetical protein